MIRDNLLFAGDVQEKLDDTIAYVKVSIRVNAIAPGSFLTGQNEQLLKNKDGSYTERSQKI